MVSFDCAWAHKRRSYQCFGAIISAITGKTIGWNVIENKNISPQSLESEVLKSLIEIYEDKRIIGHVQDGDVSTINLIREFNDNIIIFYDPNHIKGKFQRILEKFNQKCNNCFSSIKNHLLNYFKSLLYNKVLTTRQKKFQWNNVINHLMGEHGNCFHTMLNVANSPDPKEIIYKEEEEDSISDLDFEAFQWEAPPSEADVPGPILDKNEYPNLLYYLTKFLKYTETLFEYVSPRLSTQQNESINSLKP